MKKSNKKIIIVIILMAIIGIIFISISVLKNSTYKDFDKENSNNNGILKDEILLMLVNYENEIPNNYSPELTEYDGYKFSIYLEDDFKEMIKDAKKSGYNIEISSAYRSNKEQQKIYDDKYNNYIKMGMKKEDAKYLTEKEVAVPGYSEHETGLALDLSIMGDLDEKETAWNYLKNNSYKYGFINRYPDGKTKITKINSEPWHFRYVGKENAKKIFDKNVCLEEYLSEK